MSIGSFAFVFSIASGIAAIAYNLGQAHSDGTRTASAPAATDVRTTAASKLEGTPPILPQNPTANNYQIISGSASLTDWLSDSENKSLLDSLRQQNILSPVAPELDGLNIPRMPDNIYAYSVNLSRIYYDEVNMSFFRSVGFRAEIHKFGGNIFVVGFVRPEIASLILSGSTKKDSMIFSRGRRGDVLIRININSLSSMKTRLIQSGPAIYAIDLEFR
jgi:hypothetical protein